MEASALITSTGNKQNITQNSSLMSGKSNVAADTIVNTAFQSYKKQAGDNTVTGVWAMVHPSIMRLKWPL